MSFENPVVGGTKLIRAAIESPNFQPDTSVPGQGWQINSDGTATFDALNVRGDANGDIAVYNTVVANNSLVYQGQELTDFINNSFNVTIAQGSFAAPSPEATITTTESLVIQINCDVDATRSFTIHVSPFGLRTAAGQRVIALVRYRLSSGGDATLTDPFVTLWQDTPDGITAVSGEARIDGLASGNYNFALTLRVISPAASTCTIAAGDLINLWIEDAGLTTTNTAKNMLTGATPPGVKKFQILSTGSRSYDASGALFSAANLNQYMYQGQYSGSSFGNQRSWMIFPLTGGTANLNDMIGVPLSQISYFDIYLYFPHWWYISGGFAQIGHHNVASLGSTEPGGGVYQEVIKTWPGRNIGQWVSLKGNAAIMAAVNAGNLNGFIVSGRTTADPNYLQYYGFAYGSGGANPPQLRARYTK